MRVREFCAPWSTHAITDNTALVTQTRVRHMSSLGPSAGLAKSPGRMFEHEAPVVVRVRMSNKQGSVGRDIKECERRIYVYELRAV
jgi:hypothetical protein